MNIDLGDVTLTINAKVRGLNRYRVRWHIGAPYESDGADLTVKGPPYATTPRRVDLTMDLQADKQVRLASEWTDERGNPVDKPADATAVFTVDDPTIVVLTDNGDGTALAVAGELGMANVHGEFMGNGQTLTGDLQIVVVPGLAERVNIVASEPEESTPDV